MVNITLLQFCQFLEYPLCNKKLLLLVLENFVNTKLWMYFLNINKHVNTNEKPYKIRNNNKFMHIYT